MSKVLKTNGLVTTSLRRAMIPEDQSTFTCQDIRDIMNEELGVHILPMVMRAHEEYYVIDEDQTLSTCTIRYRIPYRAVGNKLRDVQFVDNAGTQYEMTRVSLEDRPEYQGNYTNNQFLTFYVENDSIVLMQNQISNGAIRMSYYLRPNELVQNNREGEITEISNQTACVVITSFANLVSGTADTITVASTVFTATSCAVCPGSALFQAASSDTATAASLATQINAHSSASSIVTATACGSCVAIVANSSSLNLIVSYRDNDCNIGATVSDIVIKFTLDSFPTHFTCTTVFDFIQGLSPNKIIAFDRTVCSSNTLLSTITFKKSQLNTIDLFSITPKQLTFNVGDFIMKAEETTYPQLPAELQPILAQRTAIKMLEALGDTEGMQNAQKELERMEYNAMTLIDNRVEGSPQKITNRHSILKSSLSNKLYRRRGL